MFFDFQKAFDLVDHTILLNKLKTFQFPNWIVPWVAQYLSGREQRVKVDERASSWSPVTAGVIQGSVLGPTLFLLFIADINEHIDDIVELIKYADDILVYNIIKDLSEDKVQQAVDAIADWAKNNKMKLNESKTQHMLINQPYQTPVNILLNGKQLIETSEYKYLGIKLNNKMSCDDQWLILSKKLCSNLFLFKKMKRLGFQIEQIVNSYKSLSLSLVDYAAPLLTSASTEIMNALNRCHKRFLRIINCSLDVAVEKYNLFPPAEHIDNRCKSILSRILKDPFHPTTIKLTKTNNERTVQTRSTFNFEAPKPNRERYNNSFIPKTLRALREESKTKQQIKQPLPVETTTMPNNKVACPICGQVYMKRGINIHLRTCRTKNCVPTSTSEI